MKRFAFLLLLPAFVIPAHADACDDLITALEGAITAPGSTPAQKSQLERFLDVGRAAKAAGNVAACQRAMDGQSSPTPGGGPPVGHKCEKSPDTV